MHSLGSRRNELRRDRAHNEAIKAIWFAETHGIWPLDLSPAASAVLVQRDDFDKLQQQWGDLATLALLTSDS